MYAPSYLEHYRGTYGAYIREHRMAGSVSLSMLEILQPAGEFPDPPVDELVIIQLKPSIRGRWDFGAGKNSFADAGLINVVPPMCTTDIIVDMPHLFRTFSIPGTAADSVLVQNGFDKMPDFSSIQARGTHDRRLTKLLEHIWSAGGESGLANQLFTDSVIVTLLAELVQAETNASQPTRGGLSPWQLRQVREYVEYAYGGRIGLHDLASAARLSSFHFLRAFKQTTGMTPFQYLLKFRIAKTQVMLADANKGIAEIALACGFGTQSSFTTAFVRETGFGPAKWRRETR